MLVLIKYRWLSIMLTRYNYLSCGCCWSSFSFFSNLSLVVKCLCSSTIGSRFLKCLQNLCKTGNKLQNSSDYNWEITFIWLQYIDELTFRSLSALAYLAADTIFIDCVIFWMFLTDLSLIAIAFKLAIPLAGWTFCCWIEVFSSCIHGEALK